MKRRLTLLAIAFTLGVVAFGSIKAEAAGAVKLNKTKVLLEIDDSSQLKMKNTKKQVKWSSANEDVVEVDDGYLTPVGVGSTKVTAKVKGKKYTCRVTVVDYTDMSIEQKAVVSYALKYVGNKYRYGGSSLTKGTDCSGFTMAVYKKFGYKLVHNAYGQLKTVKSVKMKNIKPGDLIFYGQSKSSCSHVGIYIGEGKVVHASTALTGIIVSDYNYRKYVGVGRVLKTETYPDDEPEEDTSETTEAAISE